MSVEAFPIQSMIQKALDDALPLTVWHESAKQGTPRPYCVFSMTPMMDTTYTGGKTAKSEWEVMWRIVFDSGDYGSPAPARPHVQAAHNALKSLGATRVGDWLVDPLRRIAPFHPPAYFISGIRVQEIGERHRLIAYYAPP